MIETIIVLAATIVVFSMFLMVYLIKDRSDRPNKQHSDCGRCDCQHSHQHHDHHFRRPKQIEKRVRPCSARRADNWSASD